MPADFVQRGQKLCAEAQYQEAVKVCRLGLLAHPTEIDGRLVLGAALMALSRHDEVLAEMRVALELDGDNPRALALKGEALLRKGDALQAHDVLARAVSAAPSDSQIRELYGEARRIREHGPDAPPPLAPPPRAGVPASGAWAAISTPGAPRRAGAAGGERSGTIEIDPDLEGVEVESSVNRVGTGTMDLPTEVAEAEESDASIELQTGDLIRESFHESGAAFDSADGPFKPRSSPAQRALAPADAAGARRTQGMWSVPASGPADRTRALQPAATPSAATAAPPPLDQMFPEDEEGVSGIEIVPSRAGGPGYGEHPGRGRSEDMRTIRQGLGLSPEGSSPGRLPPRADAVQGAQPRYPGPGPQAPQPRRGPEPHAQAHGRAGRTARAGRRGAPLLVYALLALLVLGGAVLIGIKVRNMRLSGQVDAASESADAATALDTHAGYLAALEAHARIVKAQDSADRRAARAAVAARMAASLGEGVDEARAMVTELGAEAHEPDALLARGLLALVDGDVGAARGAATELATAMPASADALYLRGRAALLEQKAAEAAEALRAAEQAGPRAVTLVALAQAEAWLGRTAEALAALDRAGQASPGHAGAAIWRARIQVRARALPALPEPEATLEALIAEGKLPAAQQKRSVSPGQVSWAALALAEVKLQRGDAAGAKAAMAVAQASQAPRDLQFRPAMASMLMALGEVAAARAQVELALTERPASPGVRLLEAQVAMDGGDPNAALAALAALGDLTRNAEALALRGRVHLALGSIEPAGVDLDAALALRPDLRDALVARAQVDVARGDARTALKRLEAVVGDGSAAAADVVAAAVEAHRLAGDGAAARALLQRFSAAQPDKAGDPRVLLEQARLERGAGALDAAVDLYRRAVAAAPSSFEARLEAATLSLDRGDAPGARVQLDVLAAEAGQNATVVAEAARLRTITGDHAGAQELLDRAGAVPAPNAALVRERGRLLLRKRDADKATQELERARSLDPKDHETRVLLMQAYLLRKNARGAKRELEDVTKGFRGSALVALVRGIEALVREKPRDAGVELVRAYQAAVDAKASPRELGQAAFWIGHALYFTGDLEGAGEWLKKAIVHDPSLADAHFLLGQIAFEGGASDRMAQRYEKAVELDAAGNPSAWYFLGEHYAGKKNAAKAKAALDTYLSRWPEGDFAADAKDLLTKLK